MAAATNPTLGQPNISEGSAKDLFLTMFSGMVLDAFESSAQTRSRILVKSVDSGKAHQFDEIGTVAASVHTIGAEIAGQTVKHGARSINVDDLIIAPVFLPLHSDALNHYEVLGRYAAKAGMAIAGRYDRDVLRLISGGARQTSSTPQLETLATGNAFVKDGYKINAGAAGLDTAAEIIAQAFAGAQRLDENNVPDNNDRTFWVRPAEYYLLVATGNDLINRDYNDPNGSLASGEVRSVAGMEIVKSINWKMVAGQDESMASTVDVGTSHGLDFSDAIALISTPESVGVVELLGIQGESEWDIRRQGTLVLSKMLVGAGILRPEACVELSVTA